MNANKITLHIMIALVLGIAVGSLIDLVGSDKFAFTFPFLDFLGSAFVKLMRLITVPVVLSSLTLGILNVGSITRFARLGAKTIVFFMISTSLAIVLAISTAVFLNLGKSGQHLAETSTGFEAKQASSTLDVFLDIVPSNILSPMVSSNMLQLIVITVLISIVVLKMEKEHAGAIKGFFEHLERISMGLIDLIMKVAPLGVFGLITKTFATQGLHASGPILYYFLTVSFVLLIQFFIIYPSIAGLFGLNPVSFLKGISRVIPVAFSTSSSNATLPFSIQNAGKHLGVSKEISSFVLPLGATINMNGTAIMQGIATVFLANIYGVDMGIMDYAAIVSLAVLASIGTAGVPSVGLIMLTMILMQSNIPVDGIALILGVDRLLDMLRTSVNVTGDSLVATVLAKQENKLDLEKFNS